MTQTAGRTVLITGANAGIGKEVARQLALRDDTGRIYLASRNPSRAQAAKAGLEAATGRSIFTIVVMDVSDPESVRAALPAIDGPLDALVMNAGGSGGRTPLAVTRSGATRIFAVNVLGHAVLLDALLAEDRLTEVALYAGSEAARGIPKFRMQRPVFAATSADELATVIDGSYFEGRKPNPALAYGQAKYIAALWMASMARQHPKQRFVTMSPGNTSGTGTLRDQPLPLRLAAKYVMPALGLSHSLQAGAGRLVDGITDPALRSGAFYASAAGMITGPVVDQADIFPDLRNAMFQDNASQAIHRFIPPEESVRPAPESTPGVSLTAM
jgi:NAD(P)-dependent dehydrogenase (short-subunit alcohol dehydrogenase family)